MKHVVSFYLFTKLERPTDVQAELQRNLAARGVVGTVLLATEGINVTLVHSVRKTLEECVGFIEKLLPNSRLDAKYSTANADNEVFYRLKIKVRDEIIQFGRSLKSSDEVGNHVNASEWNRLLQDPDVLMLDIRNDYEIAIGSFPGAIPIGTTRFSEFGTQAQQLMQEQGMSKVAMYCTGGIRCEKASHALLDLGAEAVYQLEGGILRYLETVEESCNKWQGECFVFDQRVALDKNLAQGRFDQCHACRRPISDDDKRSEQYVKSVSCPYCIDETTARQKEQFSERAKQAALAEARGERHVGTPQD